MPSKQHIISFQVLSLVAREISFMLTVAHTFNFFHQGCVFFFCFSLFIFQFFCHFQVLQFFLEVHVCQGLNSWSRLIVTLSASQTNKSDWGCACGRGRLSQTSTNGFVAQSNIPGKGRINRCECPTFFGGL